MAIPSDPETRLPSTLFVVLVVRIGLDPELDSTKGKYSEGKGA